MLNLALFIKCYLIGIVGNLSLGPIFLLTFNRSVRYGVSKGFAIGIGASIADAILFFCGLSGALTLLSTIGQFQSLMYGLGFVVLSFLGINAIRVRHAETRGPNLPAGSLPLATLKSFLMTITSPLTLIYFMSASVALVNRTTFSPQGTTMAALVVALGTFSVLAVVSIMGKTIGHRISQKALVRISHVTGIFFLCFAAYFAYLLVTTLLSLLS